MIDAPIKDINIIQHILQQWLPHASICVFGSRVMGTAKATSDIDTLLKDKGPIPLSTLAQLDDAFVESHIPYKVDMVDWFRISASFKEHIGKDTVPLQEISTH